METVVSMFLVDVPRAAAIWLVLLVLGLAAMAALVVQPVRTHRESREGSRAATDPETPSIHDRDLYRFADEVTVAADRASATAAQARKLWLTAQDDAETAWQAFTVAEAALRRVDEAAAMPTPRTPQTPAEYADRERHLHRAVVAAHWRGELSVRRLTDALAHRDGWDPRRHPVDQEWHLLQVIRDDRLAAHRTATERERAAWDEAERTATAARSLRDEATVAAAGRPQLSRAVVEAPAGTPRARVEARLRAVRAG